MMDKSIRLQNIETLRITAMFMILILHSNFVSIGYTTPESLQINPIETILKNIIESFAIIGVNLFILISGYFGISLRLKNTYKFIFQCFFYAVTIYIVFLLLNLTSFNIFYAIKYTITSWLRENWYVSCYLGVLFITPIVNPFFEQDKNSILKGMITFSIVSFILCYFLMVRGSFGGYSICWLVYMYCLGRTIRIFKDNNSKILNYPPLYYIIGYLLLTMTIAIYSIIKLKFNLLWSAWSYQSPLVVLSALCFFLFFANVRINSNILLINSVAKSSFAVYLIHTNPLIYPYFKECNQFLYHQKNYILWVVFLILIFVVSVLVDQLQMKLNNWTFNNFQKFVMRKK